LQLLDNSLENPLTLLRHL